MPYASDDGVRIYYEIHGESGPVLALLHGSGAHHACWWQQIPHYRDNFRVLTIDFPGYGLSDGDAEMFDVREFHSSVIAVLDDAEIDKAILVGQSMGGVPALEVAIKHPDRVAAAVMAHSVGGISDEAISSVAHSDREHANETYTVAQRLWSDEAIANQQAAILLYEQMGTFNVANFYRVKNAESSESTVQQVQDAIDAGVDITFLQGTADRITTARTFDAVAELLPEAHFEVAEGASHLSYWESPEVFNAALDRVLERVTQTV